MQSASLCTKSSSLHTSTAHPRQTVTCSCVIMRDGDTRCCKNVIWALIWNPTIAMVNWVHWINSWRRSHWRRLSWGGAGSGDVWVNLVLFWLGSTFCPGLLLTEHIQNSQVRWMSVGALGCWFKGECWSLWRILVLITWQLAPWGGIACCPSLTPCSSGGAIGVSLCCGVSTMEPLVWTRMTGQIQVYWHHLPQEVSRILLMGTNPNTINDAWTEWISNDTDDWTSVWMVIYQREWEPTEMNEWKWMKIYSKWLSAVRLGIVRLSDLPLFLSPLFLSASLFFVMAQ